MKLIFAGTPAAAVPSLRRLVADGHEVALVVTRPDAELGRKRILTPSAVAAAAEELGLPVLRTSKLDDEATQLIGDLMPDLAVVVAYGAFVREPLLSIPVLGWINLHFSLLPRWRGAAPVQRAIMAGDDTTGAAVFALEAGMDTGPVFGQFERAIGRNQTAGHLLESLAEDGAKLLADVVGQLSDGTAVSRPQIGEPSLAPKLTLEDGRIDWGQPSDVVFAQLRGVTPEPGAFTTIDGARLKIGEAAIAWDVPALNAGAIEERGGHVLVGTTSNPLRLIRVQPAGKTMMPAADWWRGVTVPSLQADFGGWAS